MKIKQLALCQECGEGKAELIRSINKDGKPIHQHICEKCFKKWLSQRREDAHH